MNSDFSNPQELAGKRVLITGGTTGIGRAAALHLAKAGARVLVFGRHGAELRDALEDLREVSAEVTGLVADVSKAEDLDLVFAAVKADLGGLDVLINNAGVGAEGAADETEESARYAVDTNLTGSIACSRRALEFLQPGGRIVLIGSVSADNRNPGGSVYVATKAGMQAFAEAFRRELAPRNIKVSLIQPGMTGTDMVEKSREEQQELERKGEMMTAEDIAEAIGYILTRPGRCNVSSMTLVPALETD